MNATTLSARALAARYGRREVFRDVTLVVPPGQCLGVLGPSGSGKTTLLRILVGLLPPAGGQVQVGGLVPGDAVRRHAIAYFGGEATLPGAVRAGVWGRLGAADLVLPEHRRIRTLSRGTRQLLGLRTVLSRHPLDVVVLDEPWEALDSDSSRWLSATLETKRDRGAVVVVSSHRSDVLAGLCDTYLFLVPGRVVVRQAPEIAAVGPVTSALLANYYDRLRAAPAAVPVPRSLP